MPSENGKKVFRRHFFIVFKYLKGKLYEKQNPDNYGKT